MVKMITVIDGGVTAPKGFQAAGVAAGIRKREREDFALVYSTVPANAAAVYTLNKFKAAPLKVTEAHLADGIAQAFVINSGIANAGMGQAGLEQAKEMAQATAKALKIAEEMIIVASTGVIGMPLPMEKIAAAAPKAAAALSSDGGSIAAKAIMTTDTVAKETAVTLTLENTSITIGAMAKGSGMIHPNMATMLGFITTDAAISSSALQKALTMSVDETFNMISVDGDTSTNDMVAVMANGQAGNPVITEDSSAFGEFVEALQMVCQTLAKAIAKDGEGATRLIEATVKRAQTKEDARLAAKGIISSSLVKAAVFGKDANWGRIACAVGYSGAQFDSDKVSIFIGDVQVAKDGMGLAFDEAKASEILARETVTITVDLNAGQEEATAWGCDLTYDYVKINADYRS